ncbi:MAG: alpha amylase C-terminal domain-containing protein [Kangiellaceae bacterium]|nr:alpha amylase C-terminal domain-containing protein [Kangiellaceae bacterium]
MRKLFLNIISLFLLLALTFVPNYVRSGNAQSSNAQLSEESSEFVPQWAKSAIWYQIFPERFRDGDKSNNPTIDDLAGADPIALPKQWQIHPWGSDWYQRQSWELTNGEADIATHLLRRRYGGDLQGIIDKLDYLKKLGITAIYLNPIFDSPSLHKYDAASYHHIDPNFGPDPEGDRQLIKQENPLDPSTWVWTKADELALKLIDEVHKRKMKVIFDGVFNHMGVNSFAFKDLVKNQKDSSYADWFIIKSFEDSNKGTALDYEGWFGVKSLPEWREDENGLVSGPQQYVFNATSRWMNPKNKGSAYGIDGWRLDVAYDVHHNFWKSWRKHVKSINSEAYLTAEIVDLPEKVQPYLQGDEFDGEMNYNFAFTAAEFLFNDGVDRINSTQFDQKLKHLRNIYPKGVAYVNQNLFGSHDSNRVASHIVNRGIGNFRNWGNYFGLSQAINNLNYEVRKPNEQEIQLQKLFAILQMTYVGAPMIYYGDEVGMWGANDPDSRKPMLWSDIKYDDELYLPNGSKRAKNKVDSVSVNNKLFSHYQKLAQIRNANPALQTGEFKTLITNDEEGIYAFERNNKDNNITVILNNSNTTQEINLPFENQVKYLNLLNNKVYQNNKNQTFIRIKSKWGAILKKEPR